MHPLPSLADVLANNWSLSVYCSRCRRIRVFHTDLDQLILSPWWTSPLDVALEHMKCRCGAKASGLKVERVINSAGGRRSETVLELARG
jgi:hypothetical protein